MSLSRGGLLAASLGAATAALVGCSSSTRATSGSRADSALPRVPSPSAISATSTARRSSQSPRPREWTRQNIKATTKVFTNGPLQITALGTGDLQYGYIVPAPSGCRRIPVKVRRDGRSGGALSKPRRRALREPVDPHGKDRPVRPGARRPQLVTILALEDEEDAARGRTGRSLMRACTLREAQCSG